MSAKTLDVLIFIPVIPAIPVIATWFLPWERWITNKIPKSIIGPYLLYCAFAAWYFKGGWWIVGMLAVWGIAVSVISAFEIRKARNLRRAQLWPMVEGNIIHLDEQRDDGFQNVTITYSYAVQGERYAGSESFRFKQNEEAARFKAAYSEGIIKVHYHPDKLDISAPHLQQAR